MNNTHDELTIAVASTLVKKIKEQEDSWKQIFSPTISRVGDFGWPRPDYVCLDHDLEQTIAFEFKPPNQSKREYLTGLGQAIAYLHKHHYAGLIIPEVVENFPISKFISDLFKIDVLKGLPIILVSYDPSRLENAPNESITLLNAISTRRDAKVSGEASMSPTYWSWWRDTSQYEVQTLLELSDKYKNKKGDIYSDYVWPEFWGLMVSGKTQKWDGTPRKVSGDSNVPDPSQKQNNKIPLFQLNLWDQAEGRLTATGYRLFSIGRQHGPDSKRFLDYLTCLILIEGKHLQLIYDVRDFQENHAGTEELQSSDAFRIGFERYLESKGSIGVRKPRRETTGAKISYIRDEFKIWNKLDLLSMSSPKSYFFNGRGLRFNWERITKILKQQIPD